MRVIMGTPSQRDVVWARKMAEMDYRSQMSSERREGYAEGRAEGRAEGLAGVAREMIARGMSRADVEAVTGLSAEEIERL